MTENYTPEKVAELVAEARERGKFLLALDDVEAHFDGRQQIALAEALEVTSSNYRQRISEAERRASTYSLRQAQAGVECNRLHKEITKALAAAPKLGELRWRNVDRMIGILRAALDKEGETK